MDSRRAAHSVANVAMDSAAALEAAGRCDARQQSPMRQKTLCAQAVRLHGAAWWWSKRCVGPADGQTDPCPAVLSRRRPPLNTTAIHARCGAARRRRGAATQGHLHNNHDGRAQSQLLHAKFGAMEKVVVLQTQGHLPRQYGHMRQKSRCCPKPYSCMVPRGGGAKRCVGPADGRQASALRRHMTMPRSVGMEIRGAKLVPELVFESDDQSTAMDKWCEHNCNAPEPFCPSSHCECAPKPACTHEFAALCCVRR